MHNINQLATWLPMKSEELDPKVQPVGYTYLQKGIAHKSTARKKVVRYAKNYIKHKTKFSLCFITHDKDSEKVEAWLDEKAKNIPKDDITEGFKLLGIYYEM